MQMSVVQPHSGKYIDKVILSEAAALSER
jgi:hypothetical protein